MMPEKVRVNCPGKGCGGILCNLFGRVDGAPVVTDVRPGAGVDIEWFGDRVTLRCHKRTARGRCNGNVSWKPDLVRRAFEAGVMAKRTTGRRVYVPAEMVTRKLDTDGGE